jgi:hypothetical protein
MQPLVVVFMRKFLVHLFVRVQKSACARAFVNNCPGKHTVWYWEHNHTNTHATRLYASTCTHAHTHAFTHKFCAVDMGMLALQRFLEHLSPVL